MNVLASCCYKNLWAIKYYNTILRYIVIWNWGVVTTAGTRGKVKKNWIQPKISETNEEKGASILILQTYTTPRPDSGFVKRGGRVPVKRGRVANIAPKPAEFAWFSCQKGGGGRCRFGPYLDPPLHYTCNMNTQLINKQYPGESATEDRSPVCLKRSLKWLMKFCVRSQCAISRSEPSLPRSV